MRVNLRGRLLTCERKKGDKDFLGVRVGENKKRKEDTRELPVEDDMCFLKSNMFDASAGFFMNMFIFYEIAFCLEQDFLCL